MLRSFCIAAALLWAGTASVRGQDLSTNLEAYQLLAVGCLGEVPGSRSAFRLDAAPTMPYLRQALVRHWKQQGRAVFLADTAATAPAPNMDRLTYGVDQARVRYERARRRVLRRTVELELTYALIAQSGEVLADERCRRDYSDTFERRAVSGRETPAFPETVGALPRGGFTRRYLEPAVLATASALTVFLFFRLRSEPSSGGG